MAGENNSANMSLPIPGVGITTGPIYATDVNNCLTIIDAHNHAPGSGVQITPTGLNINADLPFLNNNVISLRSARFTAQSAALAGASDLGCLYEVGADLYYNDGVGNQIRITQSGSVSGASGTITGLPSGSASAAYNSGSGTFIFQSSSNVAATLDVGSVIIRNETSMANGVTLQPINALGASYTLTLPTLPSANRLLTLDNSGNMAAVTTTDNSTLEISSNLIQVKDAGITTTKLVDASVTYAKLAASNYAKTTSVTSNITSATPVPVINLTFTATDNRPIRIRLTSGTANATTYVLPPDQQILKMWIYRDSTVISGEYYSIFTKGTVNDVPMFPCIEVTDAPAPGSYTYHLYASVSSNSADFRNVALEAIQL